MNNRPRGTQPGFTFSVELSLPLGIGLDKKNVVRKLDSKGACVVDGRVREGDQVTFVDGIDVRGGVKNVTGALNPNREVHMLMFLRVGEELAEGVSTIRLEARSIDDLGLLLGANAELIEVYSDGGAARDGRMQAGDVILAINGVDVQRDPAAVEAALSQRNGLHEIVLQARPHDWSSPMPGASTAPPSPASTSAPSDTEQITFSMQPTFRKTFGGCSGTTRLACGNRSVF